MAKRLVSLSLAWLALAPTAWAAEPSAAQCQYYMSGTDCRQTNNMDPKIVKACIMRGYDAPATCRKHGGLSSGVRVEGSTGFSYGTVQAPETSPAVTPVRAATDSNTIKRSFGRPAWNGNFCNLPGGINLCPNGAPPVTQPTNSLCPEKDDTTGMFGDKLTIGASTNTLQLPCGAALPLTSYEVTLNKNPTRIATTEYNGYAIYLYRKSGANYTQAGAGDFEMDAPQQVQGAPPLPVYTPVTSNPIPLPHHLCTNGIKSVDLTPPIAQMVTYSTSLSSLVIRLRPRNSQEMTQYPQPIPTFDPDAPEKFLILPIENNKVKIPRDCSDANTFYRTLTDTEADIVIESAVNTGCESSPAQCTASGGVAAPAPNQSCDVVNIMLGGTCAGKTQYVVLDRPNMVYPANSNPTFTHIQGRTAVLAPTVQGSHIFMQSNAILRLGSTSSPVVLNEGGSMKLSDGTRIEMFAPTTLRPANNQLVLTNGGHRVNGSGNLIQNYPAGTTMSPPNPIVPWTVKVNRSIGMPVDYMVPTQPEPYAQKPTP